ncbi:MAG: hypothetical protein ACI8RD_014038 [Bacillariaceae sp.]|jgi:hypothetical protein
MSMLSTLYKNIDKIFRELTLSYRRMDTDFGCHATYYQVLNPLRIQDTLQVSCIKTPLP